MRMPRLLRLALPALAAILAPAMASAHCDALDGPVVKAARQALESGDPALVLIWVQEKDTPEIQAAFARAIAVRGLGVEARELADLYFFETVVRVHRAGEGAAYTGLKPAGLDPGPAISAADAAIATGSAEALARLLAAAVQSGLREQFDAVVHAKHAAKAGDIAAGRRFVAAYVSFIHYAERLHEAASTAAHGHVPDHKQEPDA